MPNSPESPYTWFKYVLRLAFSDSLVQEKAVKRFIRIAKLVGKDPLVELSFKIVSDIASQAIPIIVIAWIGCLIYYLQIPSTPSILDVHERWFVDELRFRNTSHWAENEGDLIILSKLLWKLISSSNSEAPEIIKFLIESRSGVSNLTVEQKTEICYGLFRAMKKYEEQLKLESPQDITPIVMEALHHLSLMNLHLAFEVSNYMI